MRRLTEDEYGSIVKKSFYDNFKGYMDDTFFDKVYESIMSHNITFWGVRFEGMGQPNLEPNEVVELFKVYSKKHFKGVCDDEFIYNVIHSFHAQGMLIAVYFLDHPNENIENQNVQGVISNFFNFKNRPLPKI